MRAFKTNLLANVPNQTCTPMHLHPIPPRSEPTVQIHNAYPRSAAMPANRSIRNAILPTHTEWMTTAVGSPLGYPYELRCGVYHQSAMNYAAVSTHQCSTDTLRCLRTNVLRIRHGVYTPKRYEIRCGVSHQSSTALYAKVVANQGYELCCGV